MPRQKSYEQAVKEPEWTLLRPYTVIPGEYESVFIVDGPSTWRLDISPSTGPWGLYLNMGWRLRYNTVLISQTFALPTHILVGGIEYPIAKGRSPKGFAKALQREYYKNRKLFGPFENSEAIRLAYKAQLEGTYYGEQEEGEF